ncbi:sugar kinase [Ruminiclostridium cellobioparum]|uniref:Sugar kinase, ribokinase family n=1 Tax=Ruminiclostridium cellobioparum subsp. termitidis CT1112 TaxID=1195236 RepID=S0FF54_RUMCE|nr:sugar kinase [Ruminiclostridium cellobioparum]EMS69017.1 sugar kinase, ribokinase family [Ruminiclostridium cellobioparum subsp. termitidis CT1112]
MSEVLTFGESMIVFAPSQSGLLRYINNYEAKFAGAESNTAIGLCKLGHTARWFSRIGNDELGQYILYKIRAEGVDVDNVIIDNEHPTGIMIKELSGSGQTRVYYYRSGSAASYLSPTDLPPELFENVKILHVTGITPILSDSCHSLTTSAIKTARQKGIKVSFDPNIRKKLWNNSDHSEMIRGLIHNSNIVTLGLEEAEILYGNKNFEHLNEILFRSPHLEYLAIKNGAEGAFVSDGKTQYSIAPYPCNCIDSIGAGDAFNAAFLAGILENRPVGECGKMAAIAGALSTETTGDTESLPTRQQLNSILEPEQSIYR